MKKIIFHWLQNLTFTLTLICMLFVSCNQQNNTGSSNTKNNIISEEFVENLNNKEKIGDHDNLHYISNYLEEKIDTINIQYRFDLCLCPKWYMRESNEPIWIESFRDNRYTNYSQRELDSKQITVVGYFYKYKAVPLDLYDFDYLSGKFVPNARIFKIEKELDRIFK